MSDTAYMFDWESLAFGSKKPVSSLNATFIAAPREISDTRIKQLIKEYLPKGNIIFGVAKEEYVAGFEGQPQFKTLPLGNVRVFADKVNAQSANYKLYTLEYLQPELKFLLEKLDFKKVVLVNGSWKYTFHTQPPFYEIAKKRTSYEMVSPFSDEKEARDYAAAAMAGFESETTTPATTRSLSEAGMLTAAHNVSRQSFDYSFQTGVSLGKKNKDGTYQLLATTYNKVMPYQTYAMHYGASRERHFSPPHDLNHYDTVHAEVAMVIKAQKEKISLAGATLFINLLPCPPCSRMLGETDIAEFVYSEDHSDGYAVQMLEACGKKVRRVTPKAERNKL